MKTRTTPAVRHTPARRHRVTLCLVAATASIVSVLAPAGAEHVRSASSAASATIATRGEGTPRTTVVKPGLRVRTPGTAAIGSAIAVAGRAKYPHATVRLQHRTGGRWAGADRARTSAEGAFKTVAEATAVGRQQYRIVVVPRRGRTLSATFEVIVSAGTGTTPTVTPSLTPTATPTSAPTPTPTPPPVPVPTTGAGDPNDWSYLGGTTPIGWNSCDAITWSYDPTSEYAGGLADITAAVALVSQRSGLQLTYVGARGGELHVAWSDAATTPSLTGNTVGMAGVMAYTVDPLKNNGVGRLIYSSTVMLDRESTLGPGFPTTGQPGWGQVMTHELMHAVGLGHARSHEQVMYPFAGALALGAGDHTGLHTVGSSRGCLSRGFRVAVGPRPTQTFTAR